MFDEKKARRVIRFIECLKHTKGEFHGKPFKLLPWQEKIIRDVFGTVRDEDPSMRQYNQVYIEIGKKNGKSELGAALALNMLVNDDEWKAEVYPEPKDVVLCCVWASAVDAGNQHYRAADVMNTEQVINFTIRYRRDVKPGMWVRFQDEKWVISTLGEYSFKRTYLGLKASIAKGVSG